MISILYRLAYLSFESNVLQEAIRLGFLVFSSMVFMQRHYMKQPYEQLLSLFHNATFKLNNSPDTLIPVDIEIWLALLAQVVADKVTGPQEWRNIWLNDIIRRAGVESWTRALEMLRSVVWVDFIFNRLGQQAYEQATCRK